MINHVIRGLTRKKVKVTKREQLTRLRKKWKDAYITLKPTKLKSNRLKRKEN